MPPAVAAGAAAAAPAVGQIGGAIIQSRAQNKATEAQQQSAREALAFSKERLAGGDADYARKMQAWEAGRNALMQRYGIDIAPPMPGGGPGGGMPGGGGPQGAVPREISPAEIGGPGVGASPGMGRPRPGATIADMIQAKGADPYGWDRPDFGLQR